ncbi:hypothetical protein RYA05_03750 [Pseudomonas syringae pv. actinidiae]|nr:hypothetical protein [Pseudomonas syringae pv. actinidiae]
MTPKLDGVFRKAQRILDAGGHYYALEVLDCYREDAEAGRLSAQRLRGFLQGLHAAKLFDICDYDEMDRDIPPATEQN